MRYPLAIFSFIVAASTSTYSAAQSATTLEELRAEIADCAQRTSNAEKLACYNVMARYNGLNDTKPTVIDTSLKSPWTISEKIDPINDKKTVTLINTATTGTNRYGKSISLVIRCKHNRSTDVYIDWGTYLGRDAYVSLRIDNAKRFRETWDLSNDKTASFYRYNRIKLIKKFLTGNKLVAQTTPYSSNTITAVFDTNGLEDAIKSLREACDW